jgi:transcriptional regulator with XRE-family HTH domain
MTNIRDLLAKNMRTYRTVQGFTQACLAEKVKTSTHYIGMIENKIKFPSPEMIDRIAVALGLDTTDLFKMDNKMPDAIKIYRQSTINDIKSSLVSYLDDKLADLEKGINRE